MKFSLVPRSLFSRLVLLLVAGLLIAEAITALVLNQDRVETIMRTAGLHSAQRIASIVRVLDKMPQSQRREIVEALDSQGMRIDLSPSSWQTDDRQLSPENAVFVGALRFHLGDERPINFQYVENNSAIAQPMPGHPGMAGPSGMDMQRMMRQHMAENGLFLPPVGRHLIQVQLLDGQWVSFGEPLPQKSDSWPVKMMVALGMVLVVLVLVALLAVKLIIKPLTHLSSSARALGQNLQRPPLPVEGPVEVRDALQAFNAMQQQIKQYVDERARFLAAISHDLKTPLTRLRLKSGLLEDDAMREKIENDLEEMDHLIQGTLDFVRDATSKETLQAVDINALLETLQIDLQDSGASVSLQGRAQSYFACHPLSMRRLMSNLVENALKYGGTAEIRVEDSPSHLKICVSDQGPGIPEDQLRRVIEPFFRLEASRNKETGGSGLGLSIAQNIARAHGGSLTLRNRPEGGLEAIVELPRVSVDTA